MKKLKNKRKLKNNYTVRSSCSNMLLKEFLISCVETWLLKIYLIHDIRYINMDMLCKIFFWHCVCIRICFFCFTSFSLLYVSLNFLYNISLFLSISIYFIIWLHILTCTNPTYLSTYLCFKVYYILEYYISKFTFRIMARTLTLYTSFAFTLIHILIYTNIFIFVN